MAAEVRALAARHGVAREVVEDCLAGLQALSVQPGPGGRRFGPYVLERLIADLLAHPTVGPILLEGHASQEGGFASNYQLSLRRADAIYRRLLDGGVSPSRLVQRPLGEVDDDGVPEGAPRRRVEVRLILDPLFADGDVIHPFTGQEIAR